jgi:hypothetical protein
MPDSPDKPKIVVDEDWKSQVQAEKEKARGKDATADPPAIPSDSVAANSTGTPPNTTASHTEPTIPDETASTSPASPAQPPERPLPPASLTFLVTTVATEAMMALGQLPNPITGKTELRLHQAKHFVDTLAMLEEKTSGNRTPEETGLLNELLHQLRMAYVLSTK